MAKANKNDRRFLIITWDSRKKPARKELFTTDVQKSVRIYHCSEIRNNPIFGLVIVPMLRDCGIDSNLAIIEVRSRDDALFARLQLNSNENDRMLIAIGPISQDLENQLVKLAEVAYIKSTKITEIDDQAAIVFDDKRRATLFFVITKNKFSELAGETLGYQAAYDAEIQRRELALAQQAAELLPPLIEAIEEFVHVAQPAIFGDDWHNERSQQALIKAMFTRFIPSNIALLLNRHGETIGPVDRRLVRDVPLQSTHAPEQPA